VSDTSTQRALNRVESSVLHEHEWGHLYQGEKLENGLTILVPNWNHRSYLPRSLRSCLESLEHLEASGFSGEIIVIDDASRDGSQKFLRSVQLLYAEPRLRTLFLPRNLGLPRVRNLGMRMSKYRYVCLMDADNELVPANLPLFLTSIMDTGVALVHGNLIDTSGDGILGLRSGRVAAMRLTVGNNVDAFTVVDASKLLRAGGFQSDPRLYAYEDWEMILHLIYEEEKVVFVPAVMGYYYRNPGSMLEETFDTQGTEESEVGSAQHSPQTVSLVRRMFAQSGTREWDPTRVGYIYHPAVGYIE
jgi:glycosyltransferase involved in cell wall biosynthesis